MYGLRPSKRKDSLSSEDNDYEEAYAKIQFQVDFPTKSNQTLYIVGNIEELGNWRKEEAVKLIKLDENTSIWESTSSLECPVGMTIKYKYLIVDSKNKRIFEKLPNNAERSITTKKPGQYIIMNTKGDLTTKMSYVGKERRTQKRRMSRINIDVLSSKGFTDEQGNDLKDLKFNFGKPEDEYSEYISNLSPQDLLSYENNKANFEIYDAIPDFDYNQKITNKDRIIMGTIYLPFYIKKSEKKNEYDLIEDENSFLLKYINDLKNTKKINLIWVGMLKNYFDFKEEEINEIDEFLFNKGYSIIRPNKKDWQLFLFYIERIMYPIFFNSSVAPDEESIADNKKYFDAFYNISKTFLNAIAYNYQDNDFVVLQNLGLCFVPNLLINKKENTHIGLYIHSSLPSSDIVKGFPNYPEIFKSILLCDVIGFHDFTAARNFLTIMKRFLGIFSEITKKGIITLSYLGRNIIIHIKQPQLDCAFIKKLISSEEFEMNDKKYEKKFEKNELTVISFDYLFILTAIFNKLKAIDLFLSTHKELIDKCSFIMWIKGFEQRLYDEFEEEEEEHDEEEEEEEDDDEEEEEEEDEDEEKEKGKKKGIKKKKSFIKIKSELSIKQNSEKLNRKMSLYKLKIEDTVNQLKKKYNNENIITIKYTQGENTFNIYRRLAIFKHCNIFLYPFFLEEQGIYVKEFIAMKTENSKYYGAIVSENMPYMGFRSIIKVNSFDSEGILKALNQISSWTFNKVRYESDFKSIQKNSAEKWIKSFLLDMKRVMLNDSSNKCKIGLGRDIAIMKLNQHFRHLNQQKLFRYFKNSKSRLLIFNYENTLQDFGDAQYLESKDILNKKNFSKRIIKIISAFCEDPQNMVFIISKYDYESLFKIFGQIKNLGICGENGFFYKYPGNKEFKPLLQNIDWSWRETALKIMKLFAERTEGSKVTENKSNITFSYQNMDNYFGYEQADELKMHLSTILNTPALDIVTLNNGALEVKPKNVNKGAFLAKILQDEFEERKFDLIFIIGTDDTDEEMFKYLQSAVKYFYNFVKKFKIITSTITKHMSIAHYYFNEINDCVENLEFIIKEKHKLLNEEKESNRQIFQFRDDDEDD